MKLSGRLRTGSQTVPFTMELDRGTIRYAFENPAQVITVQMSEDATKIERALDGKKQTGPTVLDERVRGTDVTFEELSLRFLYWPEAEVLESVPGTISQWKLALRPGKEVSQYARIEAWVQKSSGALVKAECYDAGGRLRTAFKVISGQRLANGSWILKKMRIERMEGGKPRDKTPTYLEIEAPDA